MITLGSTARTRPLINAGLGVLLLASITVFLHVSGTDFIESGSRSPTSRWTTWLRADAQWPAVSNSRAAKVIEGYIGAYLEEQTTINRTHFYETHALNLDHSTYPAYLEYVDDVARTYLSGDATGAVWKRLVDARLGLRALRDEDLPPWPKQVITTDKTIDQLPGQFGRWKEIMPDWETRYFNDEGLVDWVRGVFGGSRAEEIWKDLPRRVLQTDVFR